MKRMILPLLLMLTLTACSAAGSTAGDDLPQSAAPAEVEALSTAAQQSTPPQADPGDLTRVDQQGMVVVEVTPVNLETPDGNLEFDISLETHSVDLSMDLAELSTLTTDTGLSVQATLWDAPLGGHHVSGRLIFPATQDGRPILDGATSLTLTILNVDAPAREFVWQLK